MHRNTSDWLRHLSINTLTLIGLGQLCKSAPISPSLLVRGRLRRVPTRWNATVWGRATLRERTNAGPRRIKLSLAVSQQWMEGGSGKGGIEVSFSSTGRDIHPSFVGRRESVRYQCSNVISLALSRAPECHTGSEAKWATTGWERGTKQEVHT